MLWHPDAERHIIDGREGKPWSGGSGRRRVVLHTWEFTTRWPNYTAPPHLTLWPRGVFLRYGPDNQPVYTTGPDWPKLRQHVPFNLASYALRANSWEDDAVTIQIEIAGRAANTFDYPDVWYRDVADLLQWCVDELAVAPLFADFTVMRSGVSAPQRFDYEQWNDFAGILGHGHVGGGDEHWDPGRIDVARLESMMGDDVVELCKRILAWWTVEDLVLFHSRGWWQAATDDVAAAAAYFKSGSVDDTDVISIVTEVLGKSMRDYAQGPAAPGDLVLETETVSVVKNIRLNPGAQ